MKYIIKRSSQDSFGFSLKGTPQKYFGFERTRIPVSKDAAGNWKTGLTKEEESRFEGLLGKGKGYLSSSGQFWSDAPKVWYEETLPAFVFDHKVKVGTNGEDLGMELEVADTAGSPIEHLMNYLKVKFLQQNNAVAFNKPATSSTLLEMISVEDEAKKKAARRNERAEAYSKYVTMSPEDKRKFLTIISKAPTQQLSNESVDDRLTEYLENQPKTFIALVNDPSVDEKFKYVTLFNAGKLTKKSDGYYFNDIRLGIDYQGIFEYTRDKSNQEVTHLLNAEFSKIK